MVLRYIYSRFTRIAPNPTTVAKAAAKREAGMAGTAPPVNMARPPSVGSTSSTTWPAPTTGTAAANPLGSSAAAPSTSASSSLGAWQQPMRNSATQSAAQYNGVAPGVGKGPRIIVDPKQPSHKQWMPDFQTVRSHPNVMAAITGGTAAGLGIWYYRRYAPEGTAANAQ